jgi:WD40 repeat protein
MTLIFAPDGKTLLTKSLEVAALWDVATGKKLLTRRSYRTVVFSRDGKWVVFHGHNGPSHIHETATGRELAIKGLYEPLALSPDGKRLAASTWGERVMLWDVAAATDLRMLGDERGGTPDDVALLPDGRVLAASWEDWGKVNLWDVKAGRSVRKLRLEFPQAEYPRTHTLALAPDGRMLAAWDLVNGKLGLWDIASGEALHEIAAPLDVDRKHILQRLPSGASLSFSRDSKRLFGVYDRRLVFCWDTGVGRQLFRRRFSDRETPPLGFSPDGRFVMAVSGRTIKLWDVATGKVAYSLEGFPAGWIYAAAFSPDGQRIAAGSGTAALVWELGFAPGRKQE